jgi:ankyrin repeat protein
MSVAATKQQRLEHRSNASAPTSRRVAALAIVVRLAAMEYFPAGKLQSTIPSMRFGEVVRHVGFLNLGGLLNLILCHRDLLGSGQNHRDSYRALRLRFEATRAAAAGFVRMDIPRSLTEGREVLFLIESPDADGWTRLMRAAGQPDQRKVRHLIAAGAQLDVRDQYDSTPLIRAATRNQYHNVMVLLQARADMEARNSDQRTALIHACSNGHRGIVEQLLQAKADPNVHDCVGWTPLIWAAQFSGGLTTQHLIDARANVNAKDPNGWTALMYAVGRGCEQVVMPLLKHGADRTIVAQKGTTALQLATFKGNSVVIQLLQGKSP